MAKSESKKPTQKGVVTSEKIRKNANKKVVVGSDGLVEVTLLKDHGVDKKGAKIKRVKTTAEFLIDRKIAK